MQYCLKLNCEKPENGDGAEVCFSCGTRLLLRNRFRILKPLGEGGLGKTYLAQDCDKMDEPCVVKQLKYESHGTQANKKVIELFLREAQQLYQMRGQAQIPDLMAYFEDEGYFYLVQELIDGEDLSQEKERGLFDEAKIRVLLADVLPILSFIHQRGVIHRDLKPANIMRRRQDGKLMLIDFGVSRQLSQGLTRVGGITIVGTPGYAPFEQMTEGQVDPGPASDLYSLGVTCFELMSGIVPYPLMLQEGYRWVENWRQRVQQPVSAELAGVMDGLLKMRSQERFQTADAVLGALNAEASLAAYRQHLAEYAQEYRKMAAAQWPLSSYLLEQLGRMRAAWGLQPEDVERVERPIRDRVEAAYQARTAQEVEALPQEAEGQQRQQEIRQAEERRRRRELEAERQRVQVLQQELENQKKQQTNAPVALSLQSFSFETVRSEKKFLVFGESVSKRVTRSAEFFREDLGNGVTLDLVMIPGGTFVMGSPESEAGRTSAEGPQREVTVPAFAMGKYPVTQAQYEALMGNNPSNFKGANRPVERVNWNEVVEFCQKLSSLAGKTYRLPSEAEWEYACRAGTTTPYFFGQTLSKSQANFSSAATTEVGSFPANDFGLYDMHGNVYEWCLDPWHEDYQGAPTDGSAWVTGGDSSRRILRGGSWTDFPRYCRSADRVRLDPGDRHSVFGFRLALSASRTS
ncbi:bifunctional serine/threonine-protein kinase/formylglycine-generating enzyme family protein [Lyngbya confervoides]|uniref:Bifunctional serine/threonine-protein kinase/formylglycine-generating enzyme family protein n=1 Tax=Lyngbya confervoides BDU141951 TaxID=1574623 RepID=A0ABD4T717_9CYAN|nr:bifunctional serine/threonine-protein kinase/formylglycine-generating enzyme family protein [Lyngbya confervoides]MCM1984266.1 bifunctional serine/threonine-protein kinase/formylglycine-generating enzyme family protein [Lyngbya confervoides BDU141951]